MLLEGILARTDVHLYDTCADGGGGEEAFGLDVRGRMMLVPLVDADAEENGALRRLVDRIGEVYSTGKHFLVNHPMDHIPRPRNPTPLPCLISAFYSINAVKCTRERRVKLYNRYRTH